MSDSDKILSQQEVDALLSAIDSGDVEVGREAGEAHQILPYDFKRPERVARDQLRAIETLYEVFARNFQATLSGQLRTMMDARVASVDQLTYSEFINSLPNPTVFTMLSAEPLEGSFILELNPIIAFPIIERLLGSGKSGSHKPDRPLTEIEWRLIEKVINQALTIMADVWSSIAQIQFKVTTRESNPQIMQIFSPNEPVISIVVELSLGEHKGYMNICIPVMSVEGIMNKISTHSWFASRRKDEIPGQEKAISEALAPAEMDVSAHLSIETMRFEDLRNLAVGDVIRTSHSRKMPVLVSVEGKPKFHGSVGSLKDRLAIRIKGPVDPAKKEVVLRPRAEVKVDHEGERSSDPQDAPNLEPILAIPIQSMVVLAEKEVPLKYVLSLRQGQIIEFDKRVDELLDLVVTDQVLARGVAVKRGEKFGLQITGIEDPREVIRALGR
jgi:flagellar motor switch protein FliM